MLFDREHCLGRHDVVNLAAGGLLLSGPADLAAGKRLTAILELPGQRALRAEAVVARQESGPTLALAFTRLSPSAEDAIQSAIVDVLERARAAQVLIATPTPGPGLAIARALSAIERQSFCVGSAVEAVRFFDLANQVTMVIADETFAGEMFGALAERHPRVVRIVLGPVGDAASQTGQQAAQAEARLPLVWSATDLRRLQKLRTRRADPAMRPAVTI